MSNELTSCAPPGQGDLGSQVYLSLQDDLMRLVQERADRAGADGAEDPRRCADREPQVTNAVQSAMMKRQNFEMRKNAEVRRRHEPAAV